MKRKIVAHCARYKTPLAIVLAGCLALLGACKDNDSTAAAAGSNASNYSGVLKTSLGDYVIKPSTCAFSREGDFDDIEIMGPGVAPDGEVFFFQFSSTGEELSVGLGVDNFMAHSDRSLKAGRWLSEPFTVQMSENGRQFTVSNIALVDANQKRIEGRASLEIDCRHP